MGKKIIIKIMLVLTGLFLVSIFSPAVVSDGCIFIPTVEEWVYAFEEKQIGVINYENGIENLTLVVDIKNSSLSADEAFWIFPIPQLRGKNSNMGLSLGESPKNM